MLYPSNADVLSQVRDFRGLGWTCERLGMALGVGPHCIYDWNAGRTSPDMPARKLLWLVWMLHFHPMELRKPGAWERWAFINQTECEARLKRLLSEAEARRVALSGWWPISQSTYNRFLAAALGRPMLFDGQGRFRPPPEIVPPTVTLVAETTTQQRRRK